MRFFRIAFAIAIIGLLSLPVLQMGFGFVPEEPLSGVVVVQNRPEATKMNWHGGAYQEQFTNWFGQELGFRGHLVKTDNQISFSLFNETAPSTRTGIVLGKDNYLYEKAYIDALNRKNHVPAYELRAQIADLISLRDQLAKKRIPLLILIAPSKAATHSEFIAEKYILGHQQGMPTDYDIISAALAQTDLAVIDVPKIFAEKKEESPHPFFARGGTHWNYFGLCQIAQEVVAHMEQLLGKRHVRIACEPTVVHNELFGADRDLLDLLNLWDGSPIVGPTPYPIVSNNGTDASFRPEVLFIGDSFLWTLTAMLRDQGVFTNQQMYYYQNTAYTYPGDSSEEIDAETWDWEGRVFNQDMIIIEVNEIGVPNIGYDFVQEALGALDKAL